MSLRLTIRTVDALTQWETDEWTTFVAIASLAAEPETYSEFLQAVRRYQPDHQLADTAVDIGGLGEAICDHGWCFVDLIGRTIVGGGQFDMPQPNASYEPLEDEPHHGFPRLWIDFPANWSLHSASAEWQSVVADRAAALGRLRESMRGRFCSALPWSSTCRAASSHP